MGELSRSQLRLRAGAPWPRARCRRTPPLRLRASRRSRCPRCRRHRATDRHSSLLDVGRRRRARGRRWPRSPLQDRPREGLLYFLQRRDRLGKLLARRRIVAARRRNRCKRRDEGGRTRAGAAARQGWGQGGFRGLGRGNGLRGSRGISDGKVRAVGGVSAPCGACLGSNANFPSCTMLR